MDTSDEYIEMCWKAEELQKSWEPIRYDCAYKNYRRYKGIVVIINSRQEDSIRDSKKDYVWLPHQDQLQDMIGDFSKCLEVMLAFDVDDYYQESFEQFWIVVVMEIRFKKRWNSDKKEWVKL